MRTFFVFFASLILLFAVSCNSSKKNEADADPANDDDSFGTESSEEDENNDDGEETTVTDKDPEEDSADDSDTVDGPCGKNICSHTNHSTGKCIPEDNEDGYSCECLENFHWERRSCQGDQRTAVCTGLPENAAWNAEEITQTWNGYEWSPETTPAYTEEDSDYRCYFKCVENHFWNGSACVNPCKTDPCAAQANSTGSCSPKDDSRYVCGCVENYWWWGERRGCIMQKPGLANICTGQHKCYDLEIKIECPASGEDFYGQDAQYAELGFCTPQDFVVNTEFPEEPTVVSKNTGLEWIQKIPEEEKSREDAVTYCENLTYAGKSDWRLPELRELLSITDNNEAEPFPDERYFPLYKDYAFWSSEQYAGDTEKAWATYVEYPLSDSSELRVLCVRGDKYPATEFESSTLYGDEVVTDPATGLMWQKDCDFNGTRGWKQALYYCENLVYAGYSDWRLPNKNELFSLVNYNKVAPASDFHAKMGEYISHAEYFTSSSGGSWAVWITDFSDGASQSYSKNGSYIRCVRSDICEEGYFLHGNECVKNPCATASCGMENSTGICIPETGSAYRCACAEGYFWNGKACADPCADDPCPKIANSDGVCTALNAELYICGCKNGYTWNDGECGTFAGNVKTLGNICTGQTKCYNNTEEINCPQEGMLFHGQDAGYASLEKCTKQSFEIKNVANQRMVVDNNTGLFWQQAIPKGSFTWTEALAYCEDLEYGGYSDWRLPEPQEILTVSDFSKSGIQLNTAYFSNIPLKSFDNSFWTSKTFRNDPGRVWIFNPQYGHITDDPLQTNIHNVMCVRGKTLPAAKFEKSTKNNETVTVDLSTGLMWQPEYAETESKEWKDALKYCENLEYAGYSDWRLPGKNELSSIINYDASDTYGTFLTMPKSENSDFWSSTTDSESNLNYENYVYEYNKALTIDVIGKLHSSVKNNSSSSGYYIRCVR